MSVVEFIGRFTRKPTIVPPPSELDRARHDRRVLNEWVSRSVEIRGAATTKGMLLEAVTAIDAGIATQDR
jgi:hypothetical protein